MKPSATVLVIEDDGATRERLTAVVSSVLGLKLGGSAGSIAEARAHLAAWTPTVMLTDLGLPDGDGTVLIREVSARRLDTLAMVITAFGDEEHVVHAIAAGAVGYLLKDAGESEIGRAITDLLAGGSPLSPSIARYVLDNLRTLHRAVAPAASSQTFAPDFSEREMEVLQLIAKGYTYSEIAGAFRISVNTVREYIRHIYRKLAVGSRGEAVFEAQALGLIGRQDR